MTLAPRLQLDFETAWRTYLTDPLPDVHLGNPDEIEFVTDLLAIADRYDAMLLDGFGVLNCGDAAVPGMPAVWTALREQGVELLILSNGATGQTADAVEKYRHLGFPVSNDDVLTSRDATREALRQHAVSKPDWRWGVSPMGGRLLDDLDGQFVPLDACVEMDSLDGFLLITTLHWTEGLSATLEQALRRSPRPVWVANPDVTAPFTSHFSLEPGYLARNLAKIPGVDVQWYGKPHTNVYELAFERLAALLGTFEKSRILMVGDSPHTDVLGARISGIDSCMTVDFGLLRGQDLNARLAQAGVWPDFVLSSVAAG